MNKATFFVLRATRTYMASEMFASSFGNSPDYPITVKGTYVGQSKQNVPFDQAAFFTPKQAKSRLKLLAGHDYPEGLIETIPFELEEPK